MGCMTFIWEEILNSVKPVVSLAQYCVHELATVFQGLLALPGDRCQQLNLGYMQNIDSSTELLSFPEN